MRRLMLVLVLAFPPLAATAATEEGQITLPLSVYAGLTQRDEREPARYAVGQSDVRVRIQRREAGYLAEVSATLRVESFEERWTLIPLLPPGTVLRRATVDGRPAQLVLGPDGLAWGTTKPGSVTLRLDYAADARRSESGFVLALPLPRASATKFILDFPGRDVDLAIVPAADAQSVVGERATRFTADIPPTSAVMVSWRSDETRAPAVGRANYVGSLEGDGVTWRASFEVELFSDAPVTVALMPASVTLNDMTVDGVAATVLEQDGRFATRISGAGRHEVQVAFQVPVVSGNGPPRAHVPIPRVPVSRFELSLPGEKTVTLDGGVGVTSRIEDGRTIASAHAPMRDVVVFSWSDAVPVDLRPPYRANASLYHAIHAEEGVLHGRAAIVWDITHGETGQLAFSVPATSQVNSITGPGGALAEWVVGEVDEEGRKTINIFLSAPARGDK